MNIFFFTGILLFVAIYSGRFFHRIKLPIVTGYILMGFLLGNIPFLSHYLTPYFSKVTIFIDEFAIAVIAFEMGTEFSLKALRKIENKIIIITITQIICTWLAIFLSLVYLLHLSPAISMVIASIGNATAPDIVILVTREYGARGKLAEYLKGIVTLDDLLTGLIFVIALPISKNIIQYNPIALPVELSIIREIVLSIALGIGSGILFSFIANEFRGLRTLFAITIGAVFFAIGCAIILHLHIILVSIIVGITFTNLSREKKIVHEVLSQIDAPLFIIFLIVNGSALSFRLLIESGVLGLAFILTRGIGKVVGSTIGSVFAKVEGALSKKIGWALLPQSEISIYLAVLARSAIPHYGNTIFAISMAGVIFFEIVGAPTLRLILTKHT